MKNLDMDEEANIQERDSIHIEGNLSNHFSNSIENFKSTDSSYNDLIENKIRDQAQRLLELQNYIEICEKRIKQMNPNHVLPVREQHLQQNMDNNKSCDVESLNNLINDLKTLLQLKDQEIMQHMRKYDSLSTKYNKSVSDTLPKNKVAYMEKNKTNFTFPSVDKIPNEKLREAYSKLYTSVKEIIVEKEQILDNLRRETIYNEEQRNYIEILKQTIDTTIVKLNINSAVQNQKIHYQDRRNVSNIDILIDFTQLKSESDRYKKDYLMSNIIVNQLKQEIDQFKRANEDMKFKKEKINETLESGIMELEQARNKVNNLEAEKDNIRQELEILKGEYENIINDYNLLLKEYEKLKAEYTTCYEGAKKMEQEKKSENEKLISQITLKDKQNNETFNELKIYKEKANDYKSQCDEFLISQKQDKTKIDDINKENMELVDKLQETVKQYEFIRSEYENLHISNEHELKSRDNEIDELIKNLEDFQKKFSEFKKEIQVKDEEIINLKDSFKEKDFIIKNLNERIEELYKIDKKFEMFQNETNELLNELNYYRNQSEDYNKTIKSLNDNLKNKEERLKALNHFQDHEQIITSLNRKNEEMLKLIENYESDNIKTENIMKQYIDEIESFKLKEKDSVKLNNIINEVKNITYSILNQAKNFNSTIVMNQESDDNYNKSFFENLNQFRFSILQLTNINFVEVLRSLDTWIKIVCSELEGSLFKLKDQEIIIKELHIKSQINEKNSKNSVIDEYENEIRRLKLHVKQLIDENSYLRNDHEILRKKCDKMSKETKSNRTDSKKHLQDYENMKSEMSKLRDIKNKMTNPDNQMINEENIRILINEIKRLNTFINIISKFISKDANKFIKDYTINCDQLFQCERDYLKLKQKLVQLENILENKENDKNNDEDPLEKNLYQNTEGELNKNIVLEHENIKSLLKEFENKIVTKQNYLNNIEIQINKIDNNEDKTLHKENDELREEIHRLKNSGGSNIFRSNYVEKPISSRKEFFNDKVDSELPRSNKLVLGSNEPPRRIINISDAKVLEFGRNNRTNNNPESELGNNLKSVQNENTNHSERLDTHPSKENKFDHISRKIRSLSKQKQNAFNLSYNILIIGQGYQFNH